MDRFGTHGAFESLTHTYYWDDVIVPSVTHIMEDTGIINYSHIPPQIREMALERGRIVHESTAMDEQEPGCYDFDPVIEPYVQCWRDAQVQLGYVAEKNGIEERIYHPIFCYAGTRDRRCTLNIGGKRVKAIIDLKTNDCPWWASLQTAAYTAVEPEPLTYRRFGVELHAGKSARIIEYLQADYSKHCNYFMAALTTYRLKHQQAA